MSGMKSYQNYIFDLYGTLVDIHTDEECKELWETICQAYAERGVSYTPAEMQKAYKRLLKQEADKLPYEFSEPDVLNVFQQIAVEKGGQITRQQAVEIADLFRTTSREYIRLYEGAADLLKTLKQQGKKVYLLSNAQAAFTGPELKKLGIDQFFDQIFLSSDHQCKKPDIHFYQKLLDTCGLDVRESIMVGNDVIADIAGAQKAGLDTFYFHSNLSPELEKTTCVSSTWKVMDGDFGKMASMLCHRAAVR